MCNPHLCGLREPGHPLSGLGDVAVDLGALERRGGVDEQVVAEVGERGAQRLEGGEQQRADLVVHATRAVQPRLGPRRRRRRLAASLLRIFWFCIS